jgi:hypothetical protein
MDSLLEESLATHLHSPAGKLDRSRARKAGLPFIVSTRGQATISISA